MTVLSIHKYVITKEKEVIKLARGSRILSATCQRDKIVVYALVNIMEEEKEDFYIKIYGTGWGIDPENIEGYTFLNTVTLLNESLVFHVFYKKGGGADLV